MPAKRDYYEVLGVPRDADAATLKKAYRRLARENHPDSNGGDPQATETFKEATEAYGVLSDRDKRARFDAGGHAAVDGRGMPFDPSSFGDFGDLFGVFSELFGVDLGGGGRRRSRPRRGEDLLESVEITLEEAASGVEREVDVRKAVACDGCAGTGSASGQRETCTECRGRGQVVVRQGFISLARPCPRCSGEGSVVSSPCARCGGAGRTQSTRRLRVRIPAGIDTGQRIRLTGEGGGGHLGAPPGDLFLDVRVTPHEVFHREEADLHRRLTVTFSQLALGAKLEIATLEGVVAVTLEAGTDAGTTIRLRGKGMPHVGKSRRGDLFLHVRARTPRRLGDRQRELLEELATLEASTAGDEDESDDDRSFIDRVKDYFG